MRLATKQKPVHHSSSNNSRDALIFLGNNSHNTKPFSNPQERYSMDALMMCGPFELDLD